MSWVALTPIPAIAIGILVMHGHGVPKARQLVQIAACVVGLTLFAIARRVRLDPRRTLALTIVTIVFLASPFLFGGAGNVHRWVSVGALQLYVAGVASPLLLVACSHPALLPTFNVVAQLTALAILAAQPDAGQTTAVGAAFLVLTWRRFTGATALLWTLSYLAMITIAWSRPDGLAPVAEVEGIVELAFTRAPWLGVLSLVAIALPTAVLVAAPKATRPLTLSLGVYFFASFIVTRLGHFPVALLGYGAGPILGMFLALAAVTPSHEVGAG